MKYNIIYEDPPWWFNDQKKVRKDGKTPTKGIGACHHYECMKIEKLAPLMADKLYNLATDNCAFFCWWLGTHHMDLAEIIKQANQRYRYKKDMWRVVRSDAFVWVKMVKDGSHPTMGPGHYTRICCEQCALLMRGSLPVLDHTILQTVMEPRRQHSRKPDSVRESIVKMFGDLPRIELFARESSDGWDTWGNETDKYNTEM